MKEWSIFLGKALLYLLIWLGFVGIVTSMDKNTLDSIPVWGKMIVVLIVFISPFWLSKLIWTKGEQVTKSISHQIKESIETKEAAKATEESTVIYADAKNRFKYLSNDSLLTKYREYQDSKEEDMIRLALEEELVERKLITHSPMHEKLDAIMTKLKL